MSKYGKQPWPLTAAACLMVALSVGCGEEQAQEQQEPVTIEPAITEQVQQQIVMTNGKTVPAEHVDAYLQGRAVGEALARIHGHVAPDLGFDSQGNPIIEVAEYIDEAVGGKRFTLPDGTPFGPYSDLAGDAGFYFSYGAWDGVDYENLDSPTESAPPQQAELEAFFLRAVENGRTFARDYGYAGAQGACGRLSTTTFSETGDLALAQLAAKGCMEGAVAEVSGGE